MKRMSKPTKNVLVICIGLLLTGSGIMVDTGDVEDGWVEFAETPGNVHMPAFAQCPGDFSRYYLIGGMTDQDVILNTLWRYHVAENHWIELEPLPVPLIGAAAACYGGSIYVAGGITTEIGILSSPTNAFLIYDIARGKWRYGPNLARRIWGAGLGAWKGKLYLFGGARINYEYPYPWPRPVLPDRQVDVYNMLEKKPVWIPNVRTPMPFPASHFGWVQSGKYIYVAGGRLNLMENSTITQRFDIEGNFWMRGPDLPAARYSSALVNSESHLHLIGGFSMVDDVPSFRPSPVRINLSLEKRFWPKGFWVTDLISDLNEPLGDVVGFCTEVEGENALWAVGGMTHEELVVDTNQCHVVENCFVDPDLSDSSTQMTTAMWHSTYLPLIER